MLRSFKKVKHLSDQWKSNKNHKEIEHIFFLVYLWAGVYMKNKMRLFLLNVEMFPKIV